MLKIGVIGMRGIGNNHAEVYSKSDKAELKAVCDLDKKRADEAARRWGARAYYSIADMFDMEDLDAVSVATGGFENGGDHFVPVMEVLDAGKHCLCEKPISNEIDKARQMVARAKEQGVCFGINLNHRFVPPAERAKGWIEDGRLGDLLLLNMKMWIDNPNETSEWFHLRALHPHSIDIMRFFCGDVRRVHAFVNQAPGRKCYSNAQVNMEFENGVVGHLTGSYDAAPRHNLEHCEVMGTEGRFVLDNCFEELVFYPRRGDELTVVRNSIMGGMTGFGETFHTRITRWIEQLVEGVTPGEIEASGDDGLAAQEIIESAIKSATEGTVVDVPV
ncbi:MAG: Gfo/Idh/MocA family oxidoreductase [Candidatus Latescibacterota bacterium]|nr:Gfo/Idh/MocA family oxidoreductase [Candidatus Latescibacterota bacterium]